MGLLYYLERARNDFFDWFFLAFTKLGEETVFLAIALIMFWCVSKRRGYYILITNFFGIIINQALKLIFKIPRPWVKDPRFTTVEGAKEAATGYSFPSGHSQNAVGTFGSIAMGSRRLWVKILCVIVCILVPVSRMYLGVHTPWDVMAGAGIALLLVLVFDFFFSTDEKLERFMPYMLGAVAVASLAFFIYAVILTPASKDENVISAAKNACTLIGCTAGLIPVYFLDKYVIKFETKAPWYVQIIKLTLGLALVLLIKSVLKSPLTALLGANYERILRYFLIVMFAGALWPLCFRWLCLIKIKKLDEVGEQVAYVISPEPGAVKEKAPAPTDTKGRKSSRRRGKARKNSNYSNKTRSFNEKDGQGQNIK